MNSCDESEVSAQDLPLKSANGLRGPRLSISHLLLWTFCSAAFLAFSRLVQEMQGALPEQLAKIQQFTNLIQCLTKGGVLTGACVLGWNRIRGGVPLIRQPGHWLLLVQAVVLIYWPVSFFLLLLYPQGGLNNPVLVLYIIISLASASVIVFASFRVSPWSWRLLFVLLGVMALLQVLLLLSLMFAPSPMIQPVLSVISMLLALGQIAISFGIIILSIKDLVSRQFRDWLHWIGVGAYIVDANMNLVWWLSNWLV